MGLYAQGIGANAERAVRRAAIKADEVVVLRTPVDTGRARANWIVSIDSPSIRELDETDSSGSSTIAEGTATASRWRLGEGPIYIANSLPYIEPLENGHSDQAPNGMTRFAVTAARHQLGREKLLKLGGKANRLRGRNTGREER